MRSFIQGSIKYFLFCAALMLTQLSLLTGKFPPPVQESFQAVKSFQETLDPENLKKMKVQAQERQSFINSIGADNLLETFEVPLKVEMSTEELERELKSLKYENMQLKSRVDNCTPNEELAK